MAKVDVTMPKMGESITEGTIIAWHKQIGDEVEQDETLLEIGTDKVDTEVPSPQAGTLVEQLVDEGDTVDVGTVIARLETEAEEAVSETPDDSPTEEADTGEAEAAQAEQGEAEQEEAEEAVAEADADESAEPEPEEVRAAAAGDGASGDGSAGGGEETEVVMPKMGESITEGTIIAWHKEVGEEVELDETLLEIGTDKVDTEVPSPAAGVLKERLVEEGETVEVGTPIAIVAAEAGAETTAEPSTSAPDASDNGQEASQEAEPEAAAPSGDGAVREPAPQSGDGGPIERHGSDGRFYSPLVRSIAEEEGLSMSELESIDGSGRDGRVTKEDVLNYLDTRETQTATESATQTKTRSAPQQAPAARQVAQRSSYTVEAGPSADELEQRYDGRVEIIEMDRMRKITAEHMVRSKATSAHVTSFAEADVTGLVKFRERHKQAFQEEHGVKLTYTPFFVKAAVDALRDHPILNASVEGDKIVVKKDYHIGIAVAIGKKGLLAPVIRNAGDLNVVGLAKKAADTAERARTKQLQPDELQGGTFTVTNIGTLGSVMGTPIINQPQVGIMATGAIKKRPVVIEDPELGDIIAVRHIMYACLSYDHRIIDGAMGASFLKSFVDALESYKESDELA